MIIRKEWAEHLALFAMTITLTQIVKYGEKNILFHLPTLAKRPCPKVRRLVLMK
jgi:hypothetical protein